MATSREAIPSTIKRDVRQRCGFGCVICGFPLYEYDHMKLYSVVKEHVAEEITLLCDKHHKEVTNGLLPRQKVIEANQNPYNIRNAHSNPWTLHYEGDTCHVELGGNSFSTTYNGQPTQTIPVLIDGIPLIHFILDDGHLLLNARIFDEFNNVVLEIVDNELVYSSTPWDIELEGRRLTIREKARHLLVSILFEPPNKIIIDKARLLCNGVEILIRPEHILLTNNKLLLQGNRAFNCQAGLIIGPTPFPVGGMISMPHVPRYLGDATEAVNWAKQIMKQTE